MFSALFQRKPPLDDRSVNWLFDAYSWAFRNFPVNVFYEQTRLVIAEDADFPDAVNSVQGRAELIFDRVAEYAGMAHWSWQVVDSTHCYIRREAVIPDQARQAFAGVRKVCMDNPLPVIYEARLVGNREALVASFSRILAQYLIRTARELPPGGAARWSQATDLLAIFMGFGVIYANSLPLFLPPEAGGAQEEQDHLSRWDATYALAIFCMLKKIPRRDVLPHLKRPLRGFFNRAMNDAILRSSHLAELREKEVPVSQEHRA